MVSQSDLLPMMTATSGALESDMAWRTNDAAGLEVSQGLSRIIAGHGRASPRDARRASRRARRRAPGRARPARARRARSPPHLRGPTASRRAARGTGSRPRERVLRQLRLRGALRGRLTARAAALAAHAVPARDPLSPCTVWQHLIETLASWRVTDPADVRPLPVPESWRDAARARLAAAGSDPARAF